MKTGNKIIAASIGLGLFAWLIDALTDYFYFYKGQPFIDQLLFDLPGHEIYMRTIILALFFIFGAVIAKVVEKRIDVESELIRHKDNLSVLVEERTAELEMSNEYLQMEVNERKKMEESLRESKKHLRQLSSRILTAQEAERKRISGELHDELGQSLMLLKLQVRSVERCLNEDQPEIKRDCENTLQQIDLIIENVRRLSRDLSPYVLEDLGLTAAVRWMVNNFEKNYGIEVTSSITEIDHMFPKSDQIIIYRIIQEAFNNIGKHSRAENVYVVVRKQDKVVSCLVEDDGIGFDASAMAEKAATEKGLGLSTMEERALMLGSRLELWSRKGNGTRICVNIPLKNVEGVYGTVQHSIGR